MSFDEMIGRNLTRVRGDMSQKDLAAGMRDRGHRWSQATVWNVERGERPLRLSEAAVLATMFGVDVSSLLDGPSKSAAVRREDEIRAKHIFLTRVLAAVDEYYAEGEGHSDDPA